ncbi:hypothetical protein [Vreelandella alkaliphila]|uniref:flagellin N-terminal helical domain-containing protein n=1 Tax=Vreelandella alkaliphila TaxID=272774 RepID=UPI003BF4DA61
MINTNQLSLSGQYQLRHSQSSMEIAIERQSSGLRINGATDDTPRSMLGVNSSQRRSTDWHSVQRRLLRHHLRPLSCAPCRLR